jgi:hypothetical protein
MTFEQWAEEMKKGLFLQIDEEPKPPTQADDRFDLEAEEEESLKFFSEEN